MSVTAVTRGTPAGIMLRDGFSSKIAFEDDLTIELWEKTVTPPGFDGGDPIDITTMWNTTVRTKAARGLYDTTDGSVTCAYDPEMYEAVRAMINVEQIITYTFADGSTESKYGFLKTFEPSELSEGSHPEATVTIVHTNRNPSSQAEEAGTLVSVAGT